MPKKDPKENPKKNPKKNSKKTLKRTRKFFDEFRDFAFRGNAFDLAVGVVIGAAFSEIIKSLVSGIIMPIVSLITRNQDFSTLSVQILGADFKYGLLLQNIINFILIAWVIFLIIKTINTLSPKKPETPAEKIEEKEVRLLTEIRDLLRK